MVFSLGGAAEKVMGMALRRLWYGAFNFCRLWEAGGTINAYGKQNGVMLSSIKHSFAYLTLPTL